MNAREMLTKHKTITCEAITTALQERGVSISRSAVEHYLGGRRQMPLWFFVQVAEIVGVPAEDIRIGQMLIVDEFQTRSSKVPREPRPPRAKPAAEVAS